MTQPASRTISDVRAGFRQGHLSAVELIQTQKRHIQVVDERLHAFLSLNPQATEDARDADDHLAAGSPGPLTGVPVAIKDNLATAGLTTTCASKILEAYVPGRTATAVRRLQDAGAIVVGKTNLDEFAMGSSTENSAYGPTLNPWDTKRVPGGSSGGSAVAVASGMTPIALGSDTGGSVRQPAAFCGVVGLKPTYGRVSRSGLVAYGSTLDQVGTFSTTVADAASTLHAMAGHDAADATSSTTPLADYVGACSAGVEGLEVGLPNEYFQDGLAPDIRTRLQDAARSLERRGAKLREVSLPHTRYSISAYYLLATAEASSNLARYDGVRYGQRVSPHAGPDALEEMYRETRGRLFGSEVLRRIMLGTYALSAGYYEAYYGKAQRARTLIRQDFLEAFDGGIDVLLTPTTPTTAFRLGEKLDNPLTMYLSDIYTVTANLAGLPAVSIPLALDGAGLPIGGQLIARDFDEVTLFRAAAALEDDFPPLVPPSLPTPPTSTPS